MRKLLSKGNAKLSPLIGAWSITAGMEVCGRICKGCFAMKEQKRWATVRTGRDYRYQISQEDTFINQMNTEIAKSKFTMIRVHASGEFYSQDYVNKWVRIAKANTEKVFYAYTKRMDEFDFSEIKALPNFVLHNSFIEIGTKNRRKVENFGNDIFIKRAKIETGGFVCPMAKNTQMCGVPKEQGGCDWCQRKENEGTAILFKQH